ncbi:NAD(P)-binding domain-containing protein [Loigolactobacillus coryniformis]|uniref:NAD(P)-binding domain-containing protein n=1 Tax=Loigolactobacillus coryniformis TaxID=1610 RepID=UPI0002FB22A0
MQKIGFIGLGIMGRPMARNLIEAGFSVSVFDINTTAVDSLVADGATASTAAEMAKSVDFIITMLPAAKHVRSVLEGTDGVFANAHSGLVVIDMSSIGPTDAQAFAEEAKKYQIATLDAPVSGGEPGAIAGTLSIMVGGEQETFKQSLPVFQGVGKDVVLVGGHGSGVTAKLANQVIVNLNIAAMSEALVLAAKAGIDIEKNVSCYSRWFSR